MDGVVLSADAVEQELFAIGALRDRSEITIVTGDREQLRESLDVSSGRPSATELARKLAHSNRPELDIQHAPVQDNEPPVSRHGISIQHNFGVRL